MHPFVKVMRTYCIDYTNSHDQSLYDEIMEPDYVVHISGFDLLRDQHYKRAVTDLFGRAPGLGLVVHELLLNGDRLCMRFSEHAAMPTEHGPRLACWPGIGLYKWNGRRLTENYVEQDYFALHQQLTSGLPHVLEPPHLDPWVTTEPVNADPSSEALVRDWLERGGLAEVSDLIEVAELTIEDLFSVGSRVPFHVTARGAYRGDLDGVPSSCRGTTVAMQVAGIARVVDGVVHVERTVAATMSIVSQLTGVASL
jgi:hypothetical protein